MTTTDSALDAQASNSTSRSLRSVVAVSEDQERPELLDALMADTNDYGVIVLESIASGCSGIKQLTPESF